MSKFTWPGLLLLLTISWSCKKEEVTNAPIDSDYFSFGQFYGECIGDGCIAIFKIENNKLYEDTLDHYPNGLAAYEGSYIQRPDSLYQMVADLSNAFPAALLDETNTVIGMPDAGDWGGIYVAIKQNGQTHFWLIDTMEDNLPAYLIPFKNSIRQAVADILH